MTTTIYDPDLPKTAEEIELEDIIRQLAYRFRNARVDSAEEKMILRQMDGIRRGSQLGRLLMEELDMDSNAVNYW
jgi:hypothetical protein